MEVIVNIDSEALEFRGKRDVFLLTFESMYETMESTKDEQAKAKMLESFQECFRQMNTKLGQKPEKANWGGSEKEKGTCGQENLQRMWCRVRRTPKEQTLPCMQGYGKDKIAG